MPALRGPPRSHARRERAAEEEWGESAAAGTAATTAAGSAAAAASAAAGGWAAGWRGCTGQTSPSKYAEKRTCKNILPPRMPGKAEHAPVKKNSQFLFAFLRKEKGNR